MTLSPSLEHAVSAAPDRDLARAALSRLGKRAESRVSLEDPMIVANVVPLLGFSRAAADFFGAHPEELESVADLHERALDELLVEAAGDAARLGVTTGLRRFRRRAGYRVAATDLAGAWVDDVMAEISSIAEACLRVALDATGGSAGLAVIGMGKLGGRELNYSSDVDVLFVHGTSGSDAQERGSRAAADAIALLSEPTADGVALRVDAGLRPEGRSGPLSRSLESMVEYYGRHAATWERQALLKARPVAGDLQLGEAFVAAVTPFVYPAVLPASAIEDVRTTKGRIEERVRSLGKEGVEVKRGRGGIRDVEFAVQLLQLVHGRREERLRDPNTLGALRGLADQGFVGMSDADTLADSYRFLRRLEHRLQLVRDLQTHELPADRRALGTLARAMGLAEADQLVAEHVEHTQVTRELHQRLFYRPLLEAFAGDAAPRPGVDRTATEELLSALGFADPAAAYRGFAEVVDSSTRLGTVLGALFPLVAPAIAFAALPDAALARFARVIERLRDDDRLADRLTDRPDAARRLAALIAASSAFADALAARPDLAAACFELPALERPLFPPTDPQAELVRVAAASASGELRVPGIGRRLASAADGLIARSIAQEDPPVPLAVIGLGKLGGEELSFGSDLDLMFVHEGEGRADFEAAAHAAEGILERIRAAGWRADADLRPEGRAGPLVRSLASYLEYWERWAETWEYQALLRARFVAGDETLGRRFLGCAADFAYPDAISFEQVASIRRMRVRMEEERVRPKDSNRFHFKMGYGSLADVQFAVELTLMRYGSGLPELRRTNTLEALEALSASRLMEDSVARSLGEAYLFLTEIKNALEIERRVPAEVLPPTPEGQTALARRLGYDERARHRLLEDYRRITRGARRAMERVFYGEDGR